MWKLSCTEYSRKAIAVKKAGQKGVFLTFMAFLLISTLILVSISTSQIELTQEKNIVEEIAYGEVNRKFNNIRHQVAVAKEGSVSQAYAEMTPFSKLEVDQNWFEIEQTMPLEKTYFENSYDSLNLSKVFVEEMVDEGIDANIQLGVQSAEWGGADEYPEIEYLVLPQCMRFSAFKDTDFSDDFIDDKILIKKGVEADGCKADFSLDSVKSYELEVHLPNVLANPVCNNAFAGCVENPDLDSGMPYAKIALVWDGCPGDLSYGFDAQCNQVVAGNISPAVADWVEVQISANDWVKIRFEAASNEILDAGFSLLGVPPDPIPGLWLKAKTNFRKPIDEITLEPGLFDFSVRKPGFGLCRATEESMCMS